METSKEGIMFTVEETHIADIKAGDTVLHDGGLKTVCFSNIKQDKWLGTTLFGDTYMGGRKLVKKANIFHARPDRH
jgi:hypothetical protein